MKKKLEIQQLNTKMAAFPPVEKAVVPASGWIKAIRSALGISMVQLGKKLGLSKQAVQNMEIREKEGSITLNSLREISKALDMNLVYGFVPNDGSLETLIERKAHDLATQIVLRASNTMKLEDQENSKERIRQAIEEKTLSIKNDLPKILWD